MVDDLVTRAHWGDLSGQNIAGLVRLSFEQLSKEEEEAEPTLERPYSGKDIKSREEQEKETKTFVEKRGGTYVYTYEEPDTSAWKRKRIRLPDGTVGYRVIRPIFEGALEDLKKGMAPNGVRVDGLIVSDIDRLTRDNRHLEDAIDVVVRFRRPIIDITGTLDLLTENGQAVARMLVTMANKASAATSRRVHKNHQARQAAGIPAGGTRAFGWESDKRTLRPSEAAALREDIPRIIAGASIGSAIRKWNAAGLWTPRGSLWNRNMAITMLRNPRLCGYRSRIVREFHPETGSEHTRIEICLDAEGNPVIGQWVRIVDPEVWESLIEVIRPSRTPSAGRNARVYLGVGTFRCDKNGCGRKLRGTKAPPSHKQPPGMYYYNCPSKSTGQGCGGVKINGPEADKLLKELVILKYESEAVSRDARAVPDEWEKETELSRVREDMEAARESRRVGEISSRLYYSELARHETRERTLLAERTQWLRRRYAAEAPPIDLRRDWDSLELDEKFAYVQRALIAISVAPAVRGRPLRERLTPYFRGPED
ncbi:recombinase family protein [Embleya sp. NPDC020886]|uniref:recombinase family protein n=1 Tax=Embleya sp. NPDC020886 TaxID=3363980 RepID=UPI003790912D